MRHLLGLTLVALALVGCGERAAPGATFDKASQPATAGGCSPLPAGVNVPMAHQLRSDSFYANKNGVVRRRVVVQLLEGTSADAIAGMDRALQAAGFSQLGRRQADGSRVRVRYRKAGYGIAHLFFDPIATAGSPVRGTITFDLPPPAFNPPRAAARPASR